MGIITPTIKTPKLKSEEQIPTYTAPAAPLDPTLDQYKTDVGFMQEQDFYDRYGLDPQRDLEDVNSMLDYEYQTAMANYGENAEQLYQMGLSGSGVSDIFQANAYSAYLGAKNDAYAAFIDAKKANKAKYQEYVSGINTGFNEYLNEYKNNRTQLENDAFSKAYDIYDGYNMEQVKQDLAALGFDQGIIDNVANRLSVLDTEGKKSQTVQKIVASILEVMPNYTGSAADQQFIRDVFGASVNEDALEQAINIATSRYTTSEAGYADMVQKFYEQHKDTYDPTTYTDANSFIKSIGVETDPNAEGYDANRYNAAYEAFETIKAEYDEKSNTAFKVALEAGLTSQSTDDAVRLILDNAGIKDVSEEMIQSVKNKLSDTETVIKEEEQVVIDETVKNEIDKVKTKLNNTSNNKGYLTYDDYSSAILEIDSIETEYGETSSSKEQKEAYRKQNISTIESYFDGSGNLDDAYHYLGSAKLGNVSETTWKDMNDQEKKKTIIEWAKGEVGSGRILPGEFYSMVSHYIVSKVTGTDGIIETDNKNAKASGLADAGDLVIFIQGLGMSTDKENTLIAAIAKEMKFKINGNQINWYGSVNGAEATINAKSRVTYGSHRESDPTILSKLGDVSNAGKGTLKVVNGTLYMCAEADKNYGILYWAKLSPGDLNVVGDGHTNTPEQARGIYDMLVVMLTKKSNNLR